MISGMVVGCGEVIPEFGLLLVCLVLGRFPILGLGFGIEQIDVLNDLEVHELSSLEVEG